MLLVNRELPVCFSVHKGRGIAVIEIVGNRYLVAGKNSFVFLVIESPSDRFEQMINGVYYAVFAASYDEKLTRLFKKYRDSVVFEISSSDGGALIFAQSVSDNDLVVRGSLSVRISRSAPETSFMYLLKICEA